MNLTQPRIPSLPARTFLHLLCASAALLATGCSSFSPTAVTATAAPGIALQGSVHGGQQPVVGATIQLYAAGTSGYGSTARAMISSTVKSTAGGQFTITNDYTCHAGDLVYLTATGGNPGVAGTQNNSALTLMVGLGPCSALSSGTAVIQVNELTTIASVWALAPFMTSISHVGTSSTNVAGLTNAFAAINNLVDTTAGSLPGPTLPAAATLPIAEINTLADILAACVNTVDSTSPAAQSTTCQSILTAATAPNALAPTETVQAALNLAHNPTLGLSLGSFVTASAPFQSTLGSTPPTSWTIAINYTGGGLSTPKSVSIDPAGAVWTANSGNNSVTKLANNGAALSPSTGFTAGSLNLPAAIAMDASGNAWISNSGNSSLTRLSSSGATGTAFTGGGLNVPKALALDAAGNIWLVNSGNNTLSEFSPAGTPISPVAGFTNPNLTAATALAISPR